MLEGVLSDLTLIEKFDQINNIVQIQSRNQDTKRFYLTWERCRWQGHFPRCWSPTGQRRPVQRNAADGTKAHSRKPKYTLRNRFFVGKQDPCCFHLHDWVSWWELRPVRVGDGQDVLRGAVSVPHAWRKEKMRLKFSWIAGFFLQVDYWWPKPSGYPNMPGKKFQNQEGSTWITLSSNNGH